MNAATIALETHSLPMPTRAGTLRPSSGNRVLQLALIASAVLHAMALGWLPGLERMVERAPLPLRILLPVPAEVRPDPAPAVAVAPAPTSVPRTVAPSPLRREARAEPAPAVAARAEDLAPAALPVPAPSPTAAVQPVAIAPAQAPAISAPDPQALAGYGASVAGAVAGHQRYPRVAQLRQWQGTTILQLEFAADGRLVESRVLSSSGHDVLDRQALDMLRAAQPLPPLPAVLAGRPLVVRIPVVFRLAG